MSSEGHGLDPEWLQSFNQLPERTRLGPQPPEMQASLKTQVGGDHYKAMAIQPVEYNHRNGLGFIEGCVVKYVSRWRVKGGIEDLRKAKHFLEMLIQLELDEENRP